MIPNRSLLAGLVGLMCAIGITAGDVGVPGPCIESPSTNDVWDIAQGVTIIQTSGLRPGSDARDMFGGAFSSTERGQALFQDIGFFFTGTNAFGNTNSPSATNSPFVHFIEWKTVQPVQIASFRLFAAGDGPGYLNEREFDHFTLKAKSAGSPTFDVVLFDYTPTHPYTFEDRESLLLLNANVTPTTAQVFRAEFQNFVAGRGYDGPRIVELDGYATPWSNTVILPQITPQGGLFTNVVSVTIDPPSADFQVRYTLDSTDPTPSSRVYSGPLNLRHATEVRARAYCGTRALSDTIVASFLRVYDASDGIPDAWREQFFGPNFQRTDPRIAPDADPDNDGATNLQEFFSGTSPTNPDSVFRVAVKAVPMITWLSETNRSYRVIRRGLLDSTNLVPLTPFIRATNEASVFIDTDPALAPSLYFIEVQQ